MNYDSVMIMMMAIMNGYDFCIVSFGFVPNVGREPIEITVLSVNA